MKDAIKKAGIRVLSRPPFSTALRARAMRANPTTILCYHTLRPSTETIDAWTVLGLDDFRNQLKFLQQNYDIVSLSDALARQGEPGRPRAVLTFDDGEWGNHAHLLPVINEQQTPVTIYVATRQIETGTPYWFDRVMNALQVTAPIMIDVQIAGKSNWQIGATPGKARWSEIGAVLEALKTEPEEDRDRLADQIVAQAGSQTDAFTPLKPMTVAELKDLAANPLVTIGAHSHGHELLDQLPIDVASKSIARSKQWLEDVIGKQVLHFAYPNGNYSTNLMAEIAKLGFETATILEERLAAPDANPFALPRIGIGRYDALDRIKLRLLGI